MLFNKNRKRRLIYNDDAYQQTDQRVSLRTRLPRRKSWYEVKDEKSFIDARTTPTFGTCVDTYVWCVGNGSDPPWGVWGQKRGPVWPVLGSWDRATDLIVDVCHSNGMEVWGSLRMNDLHDSQSELKEANDPLKGEHPEYLIGKIGDRDLSPGRVERYLGTAFNFERSEVRKHRLDFIKRNAALHDFDGYELDFTRFIWNFPLGRGRELAPLMTDFVRDVRFCLDDIGNRRGRPYTLVAHVTDSIEAALNLGNDVEVWLSEGLVDVLVVGLGSTPFALRLDRWKEIGDQYGVPIYPSVTPSKLSHDRMGMGSASHEYIRGVAAWWWHNGADGIYMFNLFTQDDVWGLDREHVYAPLDDIGDEALLSGKDKIYGIDSVSQAGMFGQASGVLSLPIALDVYERRLPLNIGIDASDCRARFQIQLWTSAGRVDSDICLRINYTLLELIWCRDRYKVDVPKNVMEVGCNDLTIWCDSDHGILSNPIVVCGLLVSVRY